jgi:hypothetical protein
MYVPDRDSDVMRCAFSDHFPRKVSQGRSRFFLGRLDIGKDHTFLVRDTFVVLVNIEKVSHHCQPVMEPTILMRSSRILSSRFRT